MSRLLYSAGPWRKVTADDETWLAVEDYNGNRVCTIELSEESKELNREAEANARLIAAAPELLSACRAALLDLCDDETFGEHRTTIETLKKAMSKTEVGK